MQLTTLCTLSHASIITVALLSLIPAANAVVGGPKGPTAPKGPVHITFTNPTSTTVYMDNGSPGDGKAYIDTINWYVPKRGILPQY
jgi:hypothetical protein